MGWRWVILAEVVADPCYMESVGVRDPCLLEGALEGSDGELGAEPLMIATVNDEVGKTRMVGRELTVESTMKDAVYYVQFCFCP